MAHRGLTLPRGFSPHKEWALQGTSELDRPAPFHGTLPSVKGSARRKLGQRNFMEQVRECRDNGYLLSSRKIGSGAFSKVYLACATRERMQHNAKLASDPRGKHHAMGLWSTHNGHPPPLRVAIKIISTAEAPVEFPQKFLPREISSLNATYKHLNVVQLYETYQNSQRSYLVLELAAHGDLLEHINWVSERRCSPGLDEEEARRLFWQLVSAVAHCRSSGIVHRDLKCENTLLDDRGLLKLTDFGFTSHWGLKSSLPSNFCGSVAYTAPEILMSKYNGEQADLWSLGIILYAMVTGKLPFKEHQTHRMLHLMHHGPTFRPGMFPECRDLIRGLLQLRPCARLGLQQVAAYCWMLPATHSALWHHAQDAARSQLSLSTRSPAETRSLQGGAPGTAFGPPPGPQRPTQEEVQALPSWGSGAQGQPAWG